MRKKLIFIFSVLLISVVFWSICQKSPAKPDISESEELENFLIKDTELNLKFNQPMGPLHLSFRNANLPKEEWKVQARKKLAEVLNLSDKPKYCEVRKLREIKYQGVFIHALVMKVDEKLSIPAYLLIPEDKKPRKSTVLTVHGHGAVEPCIGVESEDDYHHSFALELAKNGHMVLAPELRGFSTLRDLAEHVEINRLDYDDSSHFTLVTDGFLYGKTLIGETVDDLIRWENWLSKTYNIEELDTAGISYGGDICLIYPVFSRRVKRIFASGTLGSFSVIFQRCYNAPAHCVPGILKWMDRSDIAGLNAPRPIAIHYGELDTPSDENESASYNETVPQSMEELRDIYKAFGAEDVIQLIVTPEKEHEMDIPQLLKFLD
jgi:cephalosporin-C deacetylase-like acetyl esterase